MATSVVRTADFVKVMRHVISQMEYAPMVVLITFMETCVMVSRLGKRKHSLLHTGLNNINVSLNRNIFILFQLVLNVVCICVISNMYDIYLEGDVVFICCWIYSFNFTTKQFAKTDITIFYFTIVLTVVANAIMVFPATKQMENVLTDV